ncbi:MAG TPA: HAD family hydrolase [Gammaproteobacteria bacterium]|nr:HAD family hydrolase [Gammaproteobacteria bacterium]
MKNAIRCITFDLDDTLWDCHPIIWRAERRFYAWLQARYPRITDEFDPDALVRHRIRFMRARPELMHNLTALRKLWLRELARRGEYGEELVEPGFRVFWEARNEVELYEHVEATLEALGERYTIGAISNGNADVNFIGIGHLFDFTVNSEEAGRAKPHPAIFHLAAEKAGIDASRMLHVGDDPQTDVLGALGAGARAAWVTSEPESWTHEKKPDLVVAHVGELLHWLTDPGSA